MMAVSFAFDHRSARLAADQKDFVAVNHRHGQIVVQRQFVGRAEPVGLRIVHKHIVEIVAPALKS